MDYKKYAIPINLKVKLLSKIKQIFELNIILYKKNYLKFFFFNK